MNTKKHDVPEELLSGLLANYKRPEDLIGENGLLKQLTKLLVERALDAELTEHLGHERNEAVSNPVGNTRNGKSKKTLKGDFGELPIEVPRDRHGSFEPQLIPKHQTRWAGFDDKIISLYARGMTVRENHHLPQKALGHEAPVQALKNWKIKVPDLFVKNVRNHPGPGNLCVLLLSFPYVIPVAKLRRLKFVFDQTSCYQSH